MTNNATYLVVQYATKVPVLPIARELDITAFYCSKKRERDRKVYRAQVSVATTYIYIYIYIYTYS